MEKRIQFSILSYYPSLLSNENMNVGILFSDIEEQDFRFHMMRNWRRLSSFDDEVDISFVREYLVNLKNSYEQNLISHSSDFSMKNIIKYFANEFRFGPIKESIASDYDAFIEETSRIYMRLDYEVSERLSKNSELKYLKKYMRSNDVNYSTKKVKGAYFEDVSYDFCVKNYGFKSFNFQDKAGADIKRSITSAKAWAYNAAKLKSNDFNSVFIYDLARDDSEDYKIIMSILSEDAMVMNTNEATDFILDLKNKDDKQMKMFA